MRIMRNILKRTTPRDLTDNQPAEELVIRYVLIRHSRKKIYIISCLRSRHLAAVCENLDNAYTLLASFAIVF
jgi:hypothetical protein